MPLRERARLTVAFGLVCLTSLPAFAAEPDWAKRRTLTRQALDLDLPRERKQRRVVEELLGRDRARRLRKANFHIARYSHDLTPRLADHPQMHEDLSDILLSSLGRVAHKAVLRELRLEERRDSLRRKLAGRPEGAEAFSGGRAKLRIAPRFRYGSTAWMGAKLRLANHRSEWVAATSLRFGCELDGGNPGVKLAFEQEKRRAYLQYYGDHRKRGEMVELLIGFSF